MAEIFVKKKLMELLANYFLASIGLMIILASLLSPIGNNNIRAISATIGTMMIVIDQVIVNSNR